MNINGLLVFQMITDVLICIGILFLLIRFRKIFKPLSVEFSEKKAQEFSRLLEESREDAGKFLKKLDKEKRELNTLAVALDEKEKKLNDLIRKSNGYPVMSNSDKAVSDIAESTGSFFGETQEHVLSLARQGLDEEQIAHQSGLPEGEVDLILNLAREKSS